MAFCALYCVGGSGKDHRGALAPSEKLMTIAPVEMIE